MKYITVVFKCDDQKAVKAVIEAVNLATGGEVVAGARPVSVATYNALKYADDLEILCEENDVDTEEIFNKHTPPL